MKGNQNAKGKHKSVRRRVGYILITNGIENKRLLIGLSIPDGWKQGVTIKEEVRRKRSEWMTTMNKEVIRYRNGWTKLKELEQSE